MLIGTDQWHSWRDVSAHGIAHKDDKQVTMATDHVLTSTEGTRTFQLQWRQEDQDKIVKST